MSKPARILLFLLAILLILGGIALALLPRFTHACYEDQVQQQYEAFHRQSTVPVPDPSRQEATEPRHTPLDDLYALLQEKNREMYESGQPDLNSMYAYTQPGVDLTQYGLEDNIIGYLTVPRMDICLPVLLGASNENMAKGAGHMTNTSYPIGGENTNCVLAAHRGYAKTAMFRDIEMLQIGDPVYLENFRQLLAYRVCEIRVISPDEPENLLIQPDQDLLTLLTCHPFRHNYQRYLVFCRRDLELEAAMEGKPDSTSRTEPLDG